MKEIKGFFMNIRYTIKSFADIALSDIYLRLELAAAAFLIFFAYAYNLDRTGWAILAISCAAAIAGQVLYNALKKSENRFAIAAASAVIAAGALLACMFLFTDKEAVKMALLNIIYSRRATLCFGALFVIDVLFVAWFEKPEKKEINDEKK